MFVFFRPQFPLGFLDSLFHADGSVHNYWVSDVEQQTTLSSHLSFVSLQVFILSFCGRDRFAQVHVARASDRIFASSLACSWRHSVMNKSQKYKYIHSIILCRGAISGWLSDRIKRRRIFVAIGGKNSLDSIDCSMSFSRFHYGSYNWGHCFLDSVFCDSLCFNDCPRYIKTLIKCTAILSIDVLRNWIRTLRLCRLCPSSGRPPRSIDKS